MSGVFRSRREELNYLRARLRAEGWSYRDIASHLKQSRRVGNIQAFRMAHGMTQGQVAEKYNEVTKDDRVITGQQVCYWEAWPGPTGRQPSLMDLQELAQVFMCDMRDLFESQDFSHLDSADTRSATGAVKATDGPQFSRTASGGHALDTGRVVETPEGIISLSRWDGLQLDARDRDMIVDELARSLTIWAANDMNRRQILQLLGWAATSAAVSPALRVADGDTWSQISGVLESRRRVDETVIENIEAVLWRCMRQDDSLGPHAALETTLAQRSLVSLLIGECPHDLRPRLLSVWSNLSRFAGWLSFDLGSFKDAEYYYQDAREKAHAAENTPLGVMVLCNLSHLATWTKRPRVGIDYALAAQGWAHRVPDPLLRAYSSDVAARAYALNKDRYLCLSALESAEKGILSSVVESNPSSLAYFYGIGQLEATHGGCHLELGDTKEAVSQARRSLSNIDHSFVRNHAIATLSLSRAHILEGEIEEATKSLTDAAELLARNRSPRVERDFLSIVEKLREWPDHPLVIEFEDRLATWKRTRD